MPVSTNVVRQTGEVDGDGNAFGGQGPRELVNEAEVLIDKGLEIPGHISPSYELLHQLRWLSFALRIYTRTKKW